jgi:nucleoside-diphosphate-sugar epimerase
VKIAVTGASGFIGRHLVADLALRGAGVAIIGRPFRPESLAGAMRDAHAVVHLAGLVSAAREADYFAANVEGTRAVADAARRAGVRMVHISSLAASGPAPPSRPRSEDDPPHPITAYGRSKLEGERVLAGMRDLRWLALRPGVVYGPGDRAMLPLFGMAARGFVPLVGRMDAAYSVVHVADCVRAITAAVETDLVHQAIFVGHPRPVSVRDLAEGIRAAVNPRARILRVPMPITRLAAFAGDAAGALRGRRMVINSRRYAELAAEGFACRVDRLRERLGVVAQIDLEEGLVQTATWYRREGWLVVGR